MDIGEIDRLTKEIHSKVLYIKELETKLARIQHIMETPARSRTSMQAAGPARQVLNLMKEDSVAAALRQLEHDYDKGCMKARKLFPV